MDLNLLYLSHEDFQRLMRWILLRDTEGDFKKHIARYNRNIENSDVLQDWKSKKQFILDKGNENQNKFIRRFVPKGKPIENVTEKEIQFIQDFMNNYPRKLFDGATSRELFEKELKNLKKI